MRKIEIRLRRFRSRDKPLKAAASRPLRMFQTTST